MDQLTTELLKTTVQLLLLGVVGGCVSYLYSKTQQTRELRIAALEQFATLHGKFLALRYRYNAFHVRWSGERNSTTQYLADQEIGREKWDCYVHACQLAGEFQGLRAVISALFPGRDKQLNDLYAIYQQWRRQSGANQPILQDPTGQSHDEFKLLRELYTTLIRSLRTEI